MKKDDSKKTWKSKTLQSRWAQTMTKRTEGSLSIFMLGIICHWSCWIEGPDYGVSMSSSESWLGRGGQGVIATKAGMWGHQEPMSYWRDRLCWPNFSTTLPDAALQSTTLITWWHTKQFWCKVELTEQQREGSASHWAAWGIHSRWLQPSQPSWQSEPALANERGWFVFQEGKPEGGSEWNQLKRIGWHSMSLLLWFMSLMFLLFIISAAPALIQASVTWAIVTAI